MRASLRCSSLISDEIDPGRGCDGRGVDQPLGLEVRVALRGAKGPMPQDGADLVERRSGIRKPARHAVS